MYIHNNISLSSSYNEKCIRQRCRENQNTHFMFNNSFPKIVPFKEIMWKNMLHPNRLQTTTFSGTRALQAGHPTQE